MLQVDVISSNYATPFDTERRADNKTAISSSTSTSTDTDQIGHGKLVIEPASSTEGYQQKSHVSELFQTKAPSAITDTGSEMKRQQPGGWMPSKKNCTHLEKSSNKKGKKVVHRRDAYVSRTQNRMIPRIQSTARQGLSDNNDD